VNADRLRRGLEGCEFGCEVHTFEAIASTQQAAFAAAAKGAPAGALFVADEQTSGRGRHGHDWVSPRGEGIYASVLLRPRFAAMELLPLTLAAALAIADAVEEGAGLRADIRWPNDLLLGGKKFCGILIETSTDTQAPCAVLGFGINVSQSGFPPELEAIATSLALQGADGIQIEALCAAVVRHLARRYAIFPLTEITKRELFAEFERRSSYARGLEVLVAGVAGTTEGLDNAGFLKLRQADGRLATITSGDVRPHGPVIASHLPRV
jgi:BirA family biotin operon repressor/biotin-[acetyl-CoA-carboxylase] ligase